MAISNEPDYPPLLPVGFHEMSLSDLRKLCVVPFSASSTRAQIMTGLEQVLAEMQRVGIEADVWINGSFLTVKDDPEDSDIVLCVDSDFADKCTPPQEAVLNWIAGNLKTGLLCDSYVFCRYPEGHPDFWVGEWMYAYWLRQFGFSRQDGPKGLALIKAK
jgi:hypothetical protein